MRKETKHTLKGAVSQGECPGLKKNNDMKREGHIVS